MIGIMLALVIQVAGAQEARSISLDQALAMSADGNAENRIAEWEVLRARAVRDQMAANYFPKVTAEAAILHWDDELLLDFSGGGGTGTTDCTALPPPMDAMCSSFSEPSVIREQDTENYSVTVVQPITGLYAIYEGHKATRHLARASGHDEAATRARVRHQVVQAYFGALEVDELAAVAGQATSSLEAHVAKARAFHEAGLLLKSDLLQLEVALANARIGESRAQDGVVLARRRLALLTGAEGPVAPTPVEPGHVRASDSFDELDAVSLAEERNDAQAMAERVAAARAGRRAKRADLFPQIAALASWQRNEGQGSFAPPEAWYVGLSAQWQLFGGGQKHFAIREATAQLRMAEEGSAALQQGIALEAEAALREVDASARAFEAANQTIEQAEENLRLVQARFDSQLAGASDLLDAETLAAKARADHITSWYDHLVAVAAAQRALGEVVDPLEVH